jgi:Myb-like DNA-binding domain
VCTSTCYRWLLGEDEKLRAALAQQLTVLEGGVHDRRAVAAVVGTKTYAQCSRRWKRALHPILQTGRWTLDEDEKLTNIVTKGNTKWTAIATALGRTCKQVCYVFHYFSMQSSYGIHLMPYSS